MELSAWLSLMCNLYRKWKHRITGYFSLESMSRGLHSYPLLKARPALGSDQAPHALVQLGFESFQEVWRGDSSQKKFLLISSLNLFQFVSVVCHPSTLHHCEQPGSISMTAGAHHGLSFSAHCPPLQGFSYRATIKYSQSPFNPTQSFQKIYPLLGSTQHLFLLNFMGFLSAHSSRSLQLCPQARRVAWWQIIMKKPIEM